MELTYHGHSAFELTSDSGETVVVDPYINNNPHTDKTADEFDDVQGILVTHGAFDHLGDAREIAENTGAEIICDPATGVSLEKHGFPSEQLSPLIWGVDADRSGWSAKVVEARHVSVIADDELIGPPLAYIVYMDGQRIYHMADTSIFLDIKLFADLYDPNVVLIPVGQAVGYYPLLQPDEAALATEWLNPEIAVPIHYEPASSNPTEYQEECKKRGITKTTTVNQMAAGQSLKL